MTVIRTIVVLLLLVSPTLAQQLVLQWPIAYSGTGPRGVGWDLERGGWPTFVAGKVRPAIEWAKASGVEVAVLVHHPWGQIGDPMYLDGYDQAKAEKVKHLVNDFATLRGWKSIDAPKYGYVGGVDLTPRLKSQSVAARCALTCRNLQPLVDAGFRGVFVDYGENAISVEFVGVNAAQSNRPSADVLTLAIADAMFPEPAGIEATPRAFEPFRHLWSRRCVLQESTYQHRYGASRHGSWQALGYDRSVLTGPLWRTLDYSDDVAATVAKAQAIAADGDVPVICPAPLIRAGIKAKELTE